MSKYLNEAGIQRLLQKIENRISQKIAQSGGGGGGECAGGLQVATFMAPCNLLMTVFENSEGGWNVELGFNVTDNDDGTVTLSDFDFTYDLDATFFRDYWILTQVDDDTVERLSIATFLDALEGLGLIKPNPLYGMGVVSASDSSGYTYIGFLYCECPPDTEDSSPLQDLTDILSISYLQIGYAIPTVTEYEFTGGMFKMAGRTVKSTPIRQTLQDRLNAIREARNNDDIQRH